MSEIFARLGEWAQWENPYKTIDNSYIEGVWWALKKIWEKKALYEGSKVLFWHTGGLPANFYYKDKLT